MYFVYFSKSRTKLTTTINQIFNMKKSHSGPPPAKKSKSTKSPPASPAPEIKIENLIKTFNTERNKAAKSIIDFDFKKKRVQILSKAQEVPESSNGIVYWMSRDGRVQDNWAFLFAQKLALKNKIPLYVCFCLVPKFLDATLRHFKFMLKGLEEVEKECRDLNISFYLLLGNAAESIPKFVEKNQIAAVVCDFSPLRVPMKWVNDVKDNLPENVPLCQVDAHNIVPVWVTSPKQEYAARTIRNKVNGNLKMYLTEFPPIIKHPYSSKIDAEPVDWNKALDSLEVDRTIDEVEWAKPGYEAGIQMLQSFIEKRLRIFNLKRNDPTANALSNLSPWFHFGQISVQRCVLAVQKFKSRYSDSVGSFCEESIVRRELADNFCYYNKDYDNLKGLSNWAYTTLNDHRKDKRTYVYTKEQFENSLTHDDLWNSAQIQLCKEGKIHGFLRMYWAKKILEWTSSPEEALEFAIYLNDRYSLDGRDPNGYVGCMWSIGGIHDQGWGERQIFGKIRFMNYEGCKRKFDVAAFVARYGGKIHKIKK